MLFIQNFIMQNSNIMAISQKVLFTYAGFVLTYYFKKTYDDSVNMLTKYQDNKLSNEEKRYIHNEITAAKYGAWSKGVQRFIETLFLPYTVMIDTLPYIVVYIHKNKK